MNISRKKFVLIFLISAFAFQFITNSVLGPEVRLFPLSGEWFPGTGSPILWKNTLSKIIYPLNVVLVGPLSPIFTDPDPVPPILVLAFACYWTILALIVHYILRIMLNRNTNSR